MPPRTASSLRHGGAGGPRNNDAPTRSVFREGRLDSALKVFAWLLIAAVAPMAGCLEGAGDPSDGASACGGPSVADWRAFPVDYGPEGRLTVVNLPMEALNREFNKTEESLVHLEFLLGDVPDIDAENVFIGAYAQLESGVAHPTSLGLTTQNHFAEGTGGVPRTGAAQEKPLDTEFFRLALRTTDGYVQSEGMSIIIGVKAPGKGQVTVAVRPNVERLDSSEKIRMLQTSIDCHVQTGTMLTLPVKGHAEGYSAALYFESWDADRYENRGVVDWHGFNVDEEFHAGTEVGMADRTLSLSLNHQADEGWTFFDLVQFVGPQESASNVLRAELHDLSINEATGSHPRAPICSFSDCILNAAAYHAYATWEGEDGMEFSFEHQVTGGPPTQQYLDVFLVTFSQTLETLLGYPSPTVHSVDVFPRDEPTLPISSYNPQ